MYFVSNKNIVLLNTRLGMCRFDVCKAFAKDTHNGTMFLQGDEEDGCSCEGCGCGK